MRYRGDANYLHREQKDHAMKAVMLVCLLAIAILTWIMFSLAALAQDSFVSTGLKSACEWNYGTSCAPVGRPRTRIVKVPVTRYKVMRHVPEHLAPLRRDPEVRGWRRGPDIGRRGRDGPRCWPVTFKSYSDEKLVRDAGLEAQRRWAGEVRAELGERFMDWDKASHKREECWQSSTSERAIDKATGAIKGAMRRAGDAITGRERDDDAPTGSHMRCMVEARPCRAEKTKDDDDDR